MTWIDLHPIAICEAPVLAIRPSARGRVFVGYPECTDAP
jgi:hypothetical protein